MCSGPRSCDAAQNHKVCNKAQGLQQGAELQQGTLLREMALCTTVTEFVGWS